MAGEGLQAAAIHVAPGTQVGEAMIEVAETLVGMTAATTVALTPLGLVVEAGPRTALPLPLEEEEEEGVVAGTSRPPLHLQGKREGHTALIRMPIVKARRDLVVAAATAGMEAIVRRPGRDPLRERTRAQAGLVHSKGHSCLLAPQARASRPEVGDTMTGPAHPTGAGISV